MADDIGSTIRIRQLNLAIGSGSSDPAAVPGNRTRQQYQTAEPSSRTEDKDGTKSVANVHHLFGESSLKGSVINGTFNSKVFHRVDVW